MESIFSIVTVLGKIQYEFENRAVLGMLEKLVIAAMNLLVRYLIVKKSYVGLLPITKWIFIGIEFEIHDDIFCTYNGFAKPGQKTRSG